MKHQSVFRKLFFVIFIITCMQGYSQSASGIYVGILPYNNINLKSKSSEDAFTSQFSISNPSLQIGFNLGGPLLLECRYGKKISLQNTNTTGNIYDEHLCVNNISGLMYLGGTFFPNKRVQLLLYGGGGFSHYHEPINKLMIVLSAKAQLEVFITRRFALYGGGYYLHSIRTKYFVESRYGVETGLMFYFSPAFHAKTKK